jgi:signal transduction histidine kinase
VPLNAQILKRLRPFLERYGDIALAGAMSVGGLVETLLESTTTSENRLPILVLLTTVPLIWRRRWPMLVMLAVFLGAVVSREAQYVEIACAAIAAYSVGAHERWRVLGVLELVAIAVAVVVIFGGRLPPPPDFLGPALILLPLWLVGNAIRQGRRRTAELAERARRLEHEQQLTLKAAQAEERERLARELHDVVAHSVSVMVVQAGAARQVVDQSPSRASEALRAVEDTGREAMQELRRILGVLGEVEPELGPQPDLTQVPALVEAVQKAGLPVELDVRGSVRPLSAVLELTAYRVIQEALTNAVKHSGLALTHVAIEYRAHELKLEVLTDGQVRPESTHPTQGRGIAGMRERVALVAGRLDAGPGVDQGYAVRAWLPLVGPQ